MPLGAPNPYSEIAWKRLARECEMPHWSTSPERANNAWDLPVRPRENARLEIELNGGMDTPVLTVNGDPLRFPVVLKPGQKLVCRGQRHWTVFNMECARVAEGDLTAAPPILKGGSHRISFTCSIPDHAMVKLVKVHEPPRSRE